MKSAQLKGISVLVAVSGVCAALLLAQPVEPKALKTTAYCYGVNCPAPRGSLVPQPTISSNDDFLLKVFGLSQPR